MKITNFKVPQLDITLGKQRIGRGPNKVQKGTKTLKDCIIRVPSNVATILRDVEHVERVSLGTTEQGPDGVPGRK